MRAERKIIDFHTHTFPKAISQKVVEGLGKGGHVKYFTDASADSLAESVRKNGLTYAVNLPVMTRADQCTKVNDSLIRQKDELFNSGIITFGGLHPAFEDYKEELKKLKENGILGIKMHPAYQGVHINDIAFKRILEETTKLGLITVIHSGLDIGFPGENFATVDELLEVLRDVQPEKFVLAHMGNWQGWDEVEEKLAGQNVYLDSSFSIGKIYAREGEDDLQPYKMNMTQERFVKLVRAIGADRVLFATDSPWADQGEYVDLVENSTLTEEEKEMIFYTNGAKLLGL